MKKEGAALLWNTDRSDPLDQIDLAWSQYIPIEPTAKQLAFLLLPHLECLFGGAGGGGKSIALLAASLQYADVPGYSALIIRRTFADLSLPGALMDVAAQWLAGTSAKWSELEKTWHFIPSDATLTFGYLDNAKDKYRYQSAAFQFIGFDELTQFNEIDYTYMFSRLRKSVTSNIPLRIRSASNPGNIGHDWVKHRFMSGSNKRRIFLPARLSDNPHIDAETYRSSLAELDPMTRKQIEEGDWDARTPGNKFKREWFQIVDVAPAQGPKIRFWDMAATEAKDGKDPDWTVGLLMSISSDKIIYICDIRRVRGTPATTEKLIKQMAEIDGRAVPIRMEQEPGSSGVKAIDDYKRRVLMGWDFKGVPSTGNKEVRANGLASQAESGNVKLVRGPWLIPFLDEVDLFPKGSHDDQVDAASGAFTELTLSRDKVLMVG